MLADKESPGRTRRSRGRPRLEDVADLERELLDTALNAFLENGYAGTSMAMIVKAAGISKTTLYSRYSSKQDLFLAIVQRIIDNSAMSRPPELDDEASSLESGLKSYAIELLKFSKKPVIMALDRLILTESHRFPELSDALAKQLHDLLDKIAGFIAACAEKEDIPCSDPLLPAQVFARMIRGYHMTMMLESAEASDEEIRDWVDKAVNLLMYSRPVW